MWRKYICTYFAYRWSVFCVARDWGYACRVNLCCRAQCHSDVYNTYRQRYERVHHKLESNQRTRICVKRQERRVATFGAMCLCNWYIVRCYCWCCKVSWSPRVCSVIVHYIHNLQLVTCFVATNLLYVYFLSVWVYFKKLRFFCWVCSKVVYVYMY